MGLQQIHFTNKNLGSYCHSPTGGDSHKTLDSPKARAVWTWMLVTSNPLRSNLVGNVDTEKLYPLVNVYKKLWKMTIYNRSTISMGQFPVHYVNVYQRDGLYCGKAMAQVSSILMLTMAVGMDGGIDLPRSLWILPFLADFLLKNYQLRFLQTSYSKSFFSCHKSMIFKFVQRVKAHLFSGKLLFSAGSHFS